jgi:hypothetical protein
LEWRSKKMNMRFVWCDAPADASDIRVFGEPALLTAAACPGL